MLLGSIEAGGTKFVCAIAKENYDIIDQIVIATTTPSETLAKVIKYFKQFNIDALGVASFGPIEIREDHPKHGYITSTPKEGWKNIDIVGNLRTHFRVPISWTTDVNGSAYGEYVKLQEKEGHTSSLVYYTIGTGVGGGAIFNGEFLGLLGHPEMGHTIVRRHEKDKTFDGCCPFHKNCLEGLASGTSFEKRLGIKGENVEDTHEIYQQVAYYIAQAALQSTLLIRPEKIIFGGSVISENLLAKVRIILKEMLNNYIELPPLEEYITTPTIENNGSATLGNFALAKQKMQQ